MSKNTVHARIRLKNDTEANWNKSTFIPLQGEVIIYNVDDTHPFSRIKIGNGIDQITNLPFVNNEDNFYCLPESYGAYGDGITDDTLAIQTALNNAILLKHPMLLTGTYIITEPIILNNKSDITIIGTKDSLIQIQASDTTTSTGHDWVAGDVSDTNPYGEGNYYDIEKRTIITGGYNALEAFVSANEDTSCTRGIFSFKNCSNILIQNINFDCNGNTHPDYIEYNLTHRYCFAIDLLSCTNVIIDGCSFTNLYNYYIYCKDINDNLIIKNNHFEAETPNQAQCYSMLGIANCGTENSLNGEILIQNNYFEGEECDNIIYNVNAIICTNNYNPMIIENNVIIHCGRGYNNTSMHTSSGTVVAFADHRLMPIDFYTNCSNVIVRNNNVISTMGGLRLCGVKNILIENNQFYFHFYTGTTFNRSLNGDPFVWICNRQQGNPVVLRITKNVTIRNNIFTLESEHNSVIQIVETRSQANMNGDFMENIFIQNNIIDSAAGTLNPILFDGIIKHLYIRDNVFKNDRLCIRCVKFTNTPSGTYIGDDIQIINNYISHTNNLYCIDIQAVNSNTINNLIIKNNYVKKGNRGSYAAIKSALPAKIIGNIVGGLIQITNSPGEGFVMDNFFEADGDNTLTKTAITSTLPNNVIHKNNYLDKVIIENPLTLVE